MPQRPRACAFDWSMSYGASQASKASERLRRQKRGSGSLRKRPMGGRLCLQTPWPSAAASSWQTRSTCCSPIAGKKGSARESAAAASATGNWPSR